MNRRAVSLGLALAGAAFASPALADGWGRYENARYGYAVDVPPGLAGQGEADNGDGQRFEAADGRVLRVWGSEALEGDFAEEVSARIGWSEDAGWTISYRTVSMLSASWSGVKGDRVVYGRAIATCSGTRRIFFTFEYDKADLAANDAVVERLVGSLKGVGGC